jgi:murein DD-endopeptidase MepM/ murein hydrolase activator NlpD
MRDGRVGELMRAVSRFALIGVVGGFAGACSSDTMRFSENPFSNPFTSREAEPRMTGSVEPKAKPAAMPRGSVASAPLAAPKSALAPVYNEPPAAPAAPTARFASNATPGWSAAGGTSITVASGDSLGAISDRYGVPKNAILSANNLTAQQVTAGRRIVIPVYTSAGSVERKPQAIAAAPMPAPTTSKPVQAAAPAKPAPAGQVLATAKLPRAEPAPKVAEAPAKARVRPGQSAAAPIAKAAEPKKVAEATVAEVAAKAHPRPGRAVPAATPTAAAPAPKLARVELTKPEPVKAEPAPVGKVVRSEPLAVPAKVAKAPAPQAPTPQPVKVAKVEPAPVPAVQPAKPEPAPKVVEAARAAKAPEPQKVATLAPAKAPLKPEPAKPAAKDPETTASLPAQPVAPAAPAAPAAPSAEFRWPARGRVISGFGASGTNEGINIAVPDGTPVKAAESGTVAYAGNEVKGYGNLVLIRHDNGYVSAYAHNGDIDVKRGQKVARGQVIAKSGQTGNVTSPQLHFEIRRGATPVDPMPYLASN